MRMPRLANCLAILGLTGVSLAILSCSTSSDRNAGRNFSDAVGAASGIESGTGSSSEEPAPSSTTQGTNINTLPPTTDPREIAAGSPFVLLQTNSQGTLLLDYRFQSTNSLAAPVEPLIEITPDGAVARNGRHTVEFDGNLNHLDAVTIRLPNGAVLQGRPAALSIIDGDGSRVWLGEIQDSQDETVAEFPNQVIYRNAFSGIQADVRYIYTLNSFEQDVILKERPLLPPEIDAATARIEIWTEFSEAPGSQRWTRRIQLRPGPAGAGVLADDDTFDFGEMQIVTGKAFHTRADANRRSSDHAPVAKRWMVEEGRAFLIETADYLTLLPELERLPQQQAARPRTGPQSVAGKFKTQGTEIREAMRPAWFCLQDALPIFGMVQAFRGKAVSCIRTLNGQMESPARASILRNGDV